jgi:hypothetical protein
MRKRYTQRADEGDVRLAGATDGALRARCWMGCSTPTRLVAVANCCSEIWSALADVPLPVARRLGDYDRRAYVISGQERPVRTDTMASAQLIDTRFPRFPSPPGLCSKSNGASSACPSAGRDCNPPQEGLSRSTLGVHLLYQIDGYKGRLR